MWPFDDPKNQIPANLPLPRVGPAPLADPKELKILELEQRVLGLEMAIIEVCKHIKRTQDIANLNVVTMENNFRTLADYVLRPRSSIMGDQKEPN